jgi:hypothetical protein
MQCPCRAVNGMPYARATPTATSNQLTCVCDGAHMGSILWQNKVQRAMAWVCGGWGQEGGLKWRVGGRGG